jgi:tetratricopeptide (TPR) repeat protein
MLRTRILISLFLLLTPVQLSAQSYLFRDAKFLQVAPAAVDSVYNLKFESGRRLVEPWKRSQPDHPIWTFWDGLELWWKIVPDLEQTTYDQEFFHTFGRVDYACTRLLARDAHNLDALLLKALSNGFMARLHANRDNWIRSLQYGKAASDALALVELHYPDIVDTKFGRGLYLYYAEALPQTYSFLKTFSWMFPEGSKGRGIAMLEDAAKNSTFLRVESTYFLGNILLNYEKKPDQALPYYDQLHTTYPDNAFFTRLYARIHFNQTDNSQALGIMEGLLQTLKPNAPVPLAEELHLLKGRLLFQQGRYNEARRSIESTRSLATKADGGSNRSQQIVATYYLAEIEQYSGNVDAARDLYRTVSRAKKPEWAVTNARERLRNLQ